MNNNLMSAIYQKFIQDGYNIASRECVGGYPDKLDVISLFGSGV